MFENILDEFRKMKGNGKIVLFGSLNNGTARFDSDIDIAVVSDDKNFVKRSEDIADNILLDYGRVVSIVKFKKNEFKQNREPIIKEIRKGRILYEGNN